MIDICLILARRLVAFYWKNIKGPYIDHWLKELTHCIALERISYSIKGKLKDYHKIWDRFICIFLKITNRQYSSHSTD